MLGNLSGVLLSVSGTIGVIERARSRTSMIPGLVVNFNVSRVRTRCITRVGLHRLGERCVLGHVDSVRTLRGRVTRLRGVLSDRMHGGGVVVSRLRGIVGGCSANEGSRVLCSIICSSSRSRPRITSCPIATFISTNKCFGGVGATGLHVDNRRGIGRNSRVGARVRYSGHSRLLIFDGGYRMCGTGLSSFSSAGTSILNSCLPTGLRVSRGRRMDCVYILNRCGNSVLFIFRGNGITGISISTCRAGAGEGGLVGTCSSGSPLITTVCLGRSGSVILRSRNKEGLLFGSTILLSGAAGGARKVRIVALGGGGSGVISIRFCGRNRFRGR